MTQWDDLMEEFSRLGMSRESREKLTSMAKAEVPEAFKTEICPKCRKEVPLGSVDAKYSFGVYAGKFCDECGIRGYRDHCGLDQPMGTQAEIDEPIEPEPYYGMEYDQW